MRAGWVCVLLLAICPIALVCAERNGIERQKKSAVLTRWLHYALDRYRSVVGTCLARLGAGLVLVWGLYVCAVTLGGGR